MTSEPLAPSGDDHRNVESTAASDSLATSATKLFESEKKQMIRWLVAHGVDHPAAEDIVQDVACKIVDSSLQPESAAGQLRGLLWTCMRRRRVDDFRWRRVRSNTELTENPEQIPSSKDGDAAAAACTAEIRDVVRAAIAMLPETERTVVTLRTFGDLSYAEISERIGKSDVTTRKVFSRACEKLSKLLASYAAA